MLTKTYAFLKKEGDDYSIVDIKIIPNDIDGIINFKNHDLAFPIDYTIYELFHSARINKENKIFKVKKNFNTDFISIEDIYIIDIDELAKQVKEKKSNSNLSQEELDEIVFEEEKNKILKNYIDYLFPRITMYEIINSIELILLNNKFISKGYYITDKNQEEIFIEIIEKDEDLLEDLEKFITYKTEFEKFSNYFHNLYNLKEEIEYLTFWEFDNLDEALKKLEEIYNKYNQTVEINESKNREFLEKIREKIKERIKNDKDTKVKE